MRGSSAMVLCAALAIIWSSSLKHSSTSSRWLLFAAIGVLAVIASTYLVLPRFLTAASRGRLLAHSISPLSAYGVEYRSKAFDSTRAPPTLQIQRVSLAWGGLCDHDTGLFVIRVEGARLQLEPNQGSATPSVKKTSSAAKPSWLVARSINLFVQHWPIAARLLSFDIVDMHVGIVHDAQTFEIHVPKVTLSAQVRFVYNGALETDGAWPEKPESASSLRRRAAELHHRISSSALQMAMRALARAEGSVSIAIAIVDITVEVEKHRTLSFDNVPSADHKASLCLVKVQQRSALSLDLDFNPAKGLLGEDTLHVAVDLGSIVLFADKCRQLLDRHQSCTSTDQSNSGAQRWRPDASARRLLRALQSAQITCGEVVAQDCLRPVRYASKTDPTSAACDQIVAAIRFISPSLRLASADSSNNARARNAFGTNGNRESNIRGVAVSASCKRLDFMCASTLDWTDAPLLQVQRISVDGFSSWRPTGWLREEMLFANDPNLRLVVATAEIASLDVRSNINQIDHLIGCLEREERTSAQHRTNSSISPSMPILPRFRVGLQLHDLRCQVQERSSASAVLDIKSDGFNASLFTSYSDICGRRPLAASKVAFEEERKWHDRMLNAIERASPDVSSDLDGRKLSRSAHSPGDLDLSFNADISGMLQPVSVFIRADPSQSLSWPIVTIGRVVVETGGNVYGATTTAIDNDQRIHMDRSSLSAHVNIGVETGVKVRIWEESVLAAVVSLVHNVPRQKSSPAAAPRETSQHLPDGVSAHLCLGDVSLFIGSPDPNPACPHRITRGLWINSTVACNYAYYKSAIQVLPHRHVLSQPARKKLRLSEDITSQALAFGAAPPSSESTAALSSVNLTDVTIRILEDVARFEAAYNDKVDRVDPLQVATPVDTEAFVAWDFENREQGNDGLPWPQIAPPNLDRQPVMRMARLSLGAEIEQSNVGSFTRLKLSLHSEVLSAVLDSAALWCVLLAMVPLRRLRGGSMDATKPKEDGYNKHERQNRRPIVTFDASIPTIWLHVSLPLGHQVFLSLGTVKFVSAVADGSRLQADHVLFHVASPKHPGCWEELARGRTVLVRPGLQAVSIQATSLRVSIPHSYAVSKLVLNINAMLKAFKLLLANLETGDFHDLKYPEAEAPKRVPTIDIQVTNLNLEARDHPLETNMNLAWRVGLIEQESRNRLEDTFEQKLQILAESHADLSVPAEDHSRKRPPDTTDIKLTDKYGISLEEARYRLDWYISRAWVRRIRRAKLEQRRRETATSRTFQISTDIRLPITVVPLCQVSPLFRAAFAGVRLRVANPELSRQALVDFMGEASAPFSTRAEFSLMVPLQLEWDMRSAIVQLRDYPLPLIRIQPGEDGDSPAWSVRTLFVIAEELAEPDSCIFLPCEIVPPARGRPDAKALHVQIAKTIMPVKTYARPNIRVSSNRTTEFTWGNSYQPAIQDVVRVIESLSHPPRDPSPKIGFWDKFRLVLHWHVTVDFTGPVHLHLKGSFDPYAVSGHGAGFALSWRGKTQLRIAQPNEQFETIQIIAEELLIAIPDLTSLKDGAAVGVESRSTSLSEHESHQEMIERRATKPCARFMNGVRVGFGFKFERTCRPWTCESCGSSENLMHRSCRIFAFKQHQDVILRSASAIKRLEEVQGHVVDSYEGFRSDFVHFSVSCIAAPEHSNEDLGLDAEDHNSLHFSPKAFAHFFAWWRLFDHTLSLPIRQGKVFPASGPPSKKFGRSLGTIKYRFDLAPVYVSHFYSQTSPQLWTQGKAQYVGLKARFGHFRADAHQRAQEKTVRHEKLKRVTTVVHKPFYAADLLLDEFRVKGIAADFNETGRAQDLPSEDDASPRVSVLPTDLRQWYNFFDFIDADRRPFDRDPRVAIVDLGDCPNVFFAKRVKARQSTVYDDDRESVHSTSSSHVPDLESSKFGHEQSHICYLNATKGVADMQRKITEQRMSDLEALLGQMMSSKAQDADTLAQRKVVEHRLHILRRHLDHLSSAERREIDDETLMGTADAEHSSKDGETTFENTFHVHCPRVFFNNVSRNIVYKYWFSSQDRKREEYTTSHAYVDYALTQLTRSSLRGVRDGINRRMHRAVTGNNQDDLRPTSQDAIDVIMNELREVVTAGSNFRLAEGDDRVRSSIGLPTDCGVKAKNQILVLKPQIALRSEVDTNSIVLLAVEEISFKGFAIVDEKGFDQVTADVMTRNFVALKGLQAFSPTDSTLLQERGPRGVPRGLDFVPLEIFLDVRSEATDYDRIVLKTDAAVSFDKFNHLRMPRGLEWPDATDESGQPVRHLRIHQDLTSVVIPRLTVSATAKHYTSLYNVVTNLLVYQDPQHVARSKQIDAFMFTFDRKDRNPQQLLTELFGLQQNIRALTSLQRGYESNLDMLSDTGKSELFKIRTDLLQATEQLFVVFEAIAVNQARDDARAALKSVTRLDVRSGGVAWHVLQDDFKPLAKFDVERAAIAYVNNKDGSSDCGIMLADLLALNSNADALFPEMLSRYLESKTRKEQRGPFVSASFSLMPPVGGISVFRDLQLALHPIRLRIEKEVGEQILTYFVGETKKTEKDKAQGDSGSPPLARSRSHSSVTDRYGRDANGESHTAASSQEPGEDVSEMRKRASSSRTYLNVSVAASAILLTWRGEGWFPDCTDLKIRTPALLYTNQTWSLPDVVDAIKKDIVRAGWKQLPDVLGQFWTHATWLRTRQHRRERDGGAHEMASKTGSSGRPTRGSSSRPALNYHVQPPTPLEPETEQLLTPLDAESGGAGTTEVQAVDHLHTDSPTSEQLHVDEREKGVGKSVKGLLGKLKPGHATKHEE